MLGLTYQQTANEIAISVSQAVGYTGQFGSNAKPLQAGFAAKAGIISARLAQNGLTGQPNIVEKYNGVQKLMAHGDVERVTAVFNNFPKENLALTEYGLVMKPYPSCGYTHRVIDCAKLLRDNPELNYDPHDPDWIELKLSDGTTLRAEVAYPLGDPHNRMSSEQLMAKFMSNANLDENQLVHFEPDIANLQRWEACTDMKALMAPFGAKL